MPCSAKFSMTFKTNILSTETSDFLRQIIFLKSFNSVFFFVTASPTKLGSTFKGENLLIRKLILSFKSDSSIQGRENENEMVLLKVYPFTLNPDHLCRIINLQLLYNHRFLMQKGKFSEDSEQTETRQRLI